MDRRRAPDAEWVPMYRVGLGRARIAVLVCVPPAAVGYDLSLARRQDPGLGAGHQPAAGAAPVPCPSPGDLARMEAVTAWITASGRPEAGRSRDRGERPMARWLAARRREAAEGTLDPAYGAGLARIPRWLGNPREAADENRWHERLAPLVAYREEGHDWRRHHDRFGPWTPPRGADPHPEVQTPPRPTGPGEYTGLSGADKEEHCEAEAGVRDRAPEKSDARGPKAHNSANVENFSLA